MSDPHRIDVHHHVLPPEYVGAMAKLGIHGGGGIPFPAWSPESSLETMDRQGIAASVVSISSPGVHFGDAAAARDLSRRCNDAAAALVAARPSRFGAFATVPLPDVDGALAEIERAIDVLKLDGVVLLASQSDGRYLGDPLFEPVFAELHRRRAVVFIHPTVPRSSESIPTEVPGFATEFTFDTSRAVANLVWTGTVERYPGVSFILSHAGGTTPFLAWRWSLLDLHPTMGEAFRARAPKGFLAYLRESFHYDTALSANPFALRSLRELVGCDRILFGSDFPFAPEIVTQLSIDGLRDFGFEAADLRRIERDNALGLLPGLRVRMGG